MRDEQPEVAETETRLNSLQNLADGLFPNGATTSENIAMPWTFSTG